MHRPPRLERHQDLVGGDRRATEDLVAHRRGNGIHDGAEPGADRRLAYAARTDRRLRIGQLDGRPLHVRRRVENRRRLAVVEPLGQRDAVVLVVRPVLAVRVPEPQHDAAQDLAAKASRVNDGPAIGDRDEVEDFVGAGFDVDLDLGEPGDVGLRRAVTTVVVARDAHQPLTGKRGCRLLGVVVDVGGQLVSIVLAAELDRLLRRLREGQAAAAG